MEQDALQRDAVMALPFLDDSKEHLMGVADALPDAASPGEVLRAFDGDIDADFMAWWVPEQQGWQERADVVYAKIVAQHPVGEKCFSDGAFPAWYGEWWAVVLQFPWAARLGEAVEAAERWINEY